jgi:hypothetical protein
MYDKELDPYLACMEIVHEIVQRIVHGFVDERVDLTFWTISTLS